MSPEGFDQWLKTLNIFSQIGTDLDKVLQKIQGRKEKLTSEIDFVFRSSFHKSIFEENHIEKMFCRREDCLKFYNHNLG